ncbi:MAG: outer membrane protein assembly factor BamD [Sumerlaeia bacterium]
MGNPHLPLGRLPLGLCLLAGLALAPGLRAAEPPADYKAALTLHQQKDYAAAHDAFAAWAKANPANPWRPNAEFLSIKSLYEAGDYDAFLAAVEALKAKAPTHPSLDDLTYLSGRALEESGRWREAKFLYRDFARAYPESPYNAEIAKREPYTKFHTFLRVYEIEKDWERARINFQVYAIDRSNPPHLREAAQFYAVKALESMKDYKAFEREAKALCAENPAHPSCDDLALMLAYIKTKDFDYEGAVLAYQDFLAQYPDSPLAAKAREHIAEFGILTGPGLPPTDLTEAERRERISLNVWWLNDLRAQGKDLPFAATARSFAKKQPGHADAPELALKALRRAKVKHKDDFADTFALELAESPLASRVTWLGGRTGQTEAQAKETFNAVRDRMKRTGNAQEAMLEYSDFLTAYGNNWRAPMAKLEMASLCVGMGDRHGFNLLKAELEGHLEPEQADRLRVYESCFLLESGQKGKAKRILEEVSARNPSTAIYEHFVREVFEDWVATKNVGAIRRFAPHMDKLYTSSELEWGFASRYLGVAAYQSGKYAEAARQLQVVWNEATLKGEEADRQKLFTAWWLAGVYRMIGDDEMVNYWVRRVEREVPPSRVRTDMFKMFAYEVSLDEI